MKEIKKLLAFIFLLIVTLTFAEGEIPHQIISDNPAKEVTTVESKKLKEKAELDILVNKITPIEIEGIVTSDNTTVYTIPNAEIEKNLLKRVRNKMMPRLNGEEKYFVTENLSQILNENQKQPRGRNKRSLPQGIDYEVVKDEENTMLTVNTDKPVYIARVRDRVIENVFSGRVEKLNNNFDGRGGTSEKSYALKVGQLLTFIRVEDGSGSSYWLDGVEIKGGEIANLVDIYIPNKYSMQMYKWFDIQFWLVDYAKAKNVITRRGVYGYMGEAWESKGEYWKTKKGYGYGNYVWATDIIRIDNLDSNKTNSLNGDIHEMKAYLVIDRSTNYPGVYRYEPYLEFKYYIDKVTSYDWYNMPTNFVVRRDSKSFTIEPKLENINTINIIDTIFDESNSTITGAGTALPNDWNYRYNDSAEGADSKRGLNIVGSGANEQRINKRRVRLTYDNGADIEVWLDNVSGVGKLRYKINKLGSTPTDAKVIVQHGVQEYRVLNPSEGTEYLYQDTVIIKIPELKSVESMDVEMDSRLVSQLNGWINIEGQPFGWTDKPYAKLIKVNSKPSFDDGEIVTRELNYSESWEQDNYKFYADGTSTSNSVALPKDSTPSLDLINKKLYICKRTGQEWKNAEIFTSTRRLINLKVTENTKAPANGYKGSGVLGMSFAKIGESIEFPMGESALNKMKEINSIGRPTDINFILKDFQGVFPNTMGMDGSQNIVDNLNVSVGGSEAENIRGTSFEKEGIRFELLTNGNLKITKIANSMINSVIDVEYRCLNVVLGKFKIKIVNYPNITDIGNATFTIDSRMKGFDGTMNWYHRDGKVSRNINTTQEDYSKLFYSTNNFSGTDSTNIYRVHSVEGRDYYRESSKVDNGYFYQVFSKGTQFNRYTAVPHSLPVRDIYNAAVISVVDNEDEESLENKFKLVTDELKPYTGNFIEEYVGEVAQTATANLDFSAFNLNTVGVWDNGATGNATSTNGSGVVLAFSDGKLFNTMDINDSEAIVTKLIIKDGNGTQLQEINGSMGTALEFATDYNKIVIQPDGQLAISKIKRCYDEKTYILEPYYNNLKLGSLKVTILNDTPIDIGRVDFNIDKRLKSSPMGWVYFDGKVAAKSINEKKDYSELVKEENNLKNLNSNKISDVISVEGRPIKVRARDYENNKLYYFLVKQGDYADESAIIPYDVPLNDITKTLGTSTYNNRFTDNIFTVETEDGIRYKGNVKEFFIGDETTTAEGEINFRKTGHIATWEPNSTGLAMNGKTEIKFISETKKVFDSRGVLNRKDSIANKLKIIQKDGETKEVTGNIGDNLIVKYDDGELFELDKDGRLTIRGTYKKTEKIFTIEAYYNEALLGKLTVTLITGDAFIIDGEDTYDFGQMLGGNEYNLTGRFNIKNLGNLNIVDVSIPETAEMSKDGDTNEKIPLFLQSSYRQIGQDVQAIIDLKAKPRVGQPVGNYSGEFYITITINE